MKEIGLGFFLIVIIFGSSTFVSNVNVQAQNFTYISGVVTSDASLTKNNSPYSFTNNVLVSSGVTLTIEPGAVIYLENFYLEVNGTLSARGTSTNKISFISNFTRSNGVGPGNGQIIFTSSAENWIEQNSTGCIIENSVLSSTTISITGSSPKINNNTLENPCFLDGITIQGGAPIISNNTITGSGSPYANDGINFNVPIGNCITNATVCSNIISGWKIAGINIMVGSPAIIENAITDNGAEGIYVCWDSPTPLIQSNTISRNPVGLYLFGASLPEIVGNNIQDNRIYNVQVSANPITSNSNVVNATNNWWGITDASSIGNTIHDFKNDFNLATVNFVPFLTSPDPDAPPMPPPIPTTPVPTFSISPNPTTTTSGSPAPPLTSSPTPTPTKTQAPSSTITSNPAQLSTESPSNSPVSASLSPSPEPTSTQGNNGLQTTTVLIIAALVATVLIAGVGAGLLLSYRKKPIVSMITKEIIVKVRCRYCGNTYDETVDQCPHCGAKNA